MRVELTMSVASMLGMLKRIDIDYWLILNVHQSSSKRYKEHAGLIVRPTLYSLLVLSIALLEIIESPHHVTSLLNSHTLASTYLPLVVQEKVELIKLWGVVQRHILSSFGPQEPCA